MRIRLALSAAALVMVFAGPVSANETPGCHGHNEQPCRDDPQPGHGGDCRHSDDHCATTTSSSTTTSSTTTTTILPPLVTTTTTEAATTTTTAAAETTTTEPAAVTTTTTAAAAPPAPLISQPEVLGTTEKKLPTTGTPTGPLASFAVGLIAIGWGTRRLGRR